jgi:hypothetical protein
MTSGTGPDVVARPIMKPRLGALAMTLYEIVVDTHLSFGTIALTSFWINAAPPKITRLPRQIEAVYFSHRWGGRRDRSSVGTFIKEGAWEG